MIIARDPTAKVCLTSLFFWIPGRGSVLINAHHVFFSNVCFFNGFFFLFLSQSFWNMSVGSWRVTLYLCCRPIVFVLMYLCVCILWSGVSECIFLSVDPVSGRWHCAMDHRLFDARLLTLFIRWLWTRSDSYLFFSCSLYGD